MIRSFRCKDTEALYCGRIVRRFGAIAKAAVRKLDMIDAAQAVDDLRLLRMA